MYCVICDPHHKLKYCGNTTNLFSHLRNKHPCLYTDIKTPVKLTNDDRQATTPTIDFLFSKQEKYRPDSSKSKELSKAVGYFVAKDMMPLNVVHGKGFCQLVEKLEPHFTIPSCKTLTERIIPTMYSDVKQSKIIPSIKNASHVALTTDCWTSKISHTAENLAEALTECLSDWSIDENQISCTSIDNATNVVKH